LRCVHGDGCARSEECRASQADQRKEGFFHVVGRLYIRMVCVEASGIGEGILRKNVTRWGIPNRPFWRWIFRLQ
jgi:hypothetical protein